MTHNIDQAPGNSQNNNPNEGYYRDSSGRLQDPQNPVHPERFRDSSGITTPVHEDGPRGELKRPKDSKTVLKVVGTIGAASLAAGAAFGIYNYNKFKDLTEDIRDGADRTVSAPYNPNFDAPKSDYSNITINTDSDIMKNMPGGVKIDSCSPYIKKRITSGAEAEYEKDLSMVNGGKLPPGGIGTGSIYDKPQQNLNYKSVGMNIIRKETNKNIARNALWCITLDPERWSILERELVSGTTTNIPVAPNNAYGSTTIFQHGTYGNTTANGQPTKAIVTASTAEDTVYNYILQEQSSYKNPSVKEVTITGVLSSSSPSYHIDDIESWTP